MKNFLFKTFKIFVLLSFVLANNSYFSVFAQEETDNPSAASTESRPQEIISLLTGEVHSIDTKNVKRIAVANPEIVDISDAQSDKVLIAGKKAGQTELFIWDDEGKISFLVRVASENMSTVKTRIEEVLEKAEIKGVSLKENPYEGKVVVYGAVPKSDKAALDKILDPYADKIINLVKEEVNEELIQIDIQVTELSTTLTKQLGLDWNTSSDTDTNSGVTGSNTTNTTSSSNGLNLNYDESSLPGKGGAKLFNIASFKRTTPITVAVNALVQEGKGKILSNPRLVVMSGKEASFLVGGEIPIRTTTVNATGGQSQDNVSFKQYGVSMTITPTIREGKVDILLNVHISDIDKSVTDANGDVGYISRSAQTQLFLDDRQTIVLAGFIKHAEGETVKGIPFLSKIPVAGALFRTRSSANPNSETEMVISLTPTILKSKKMATEQVVIPSKRVEGFKKEVESSFEKESLKDPAPEPKKEAPMAATPVQKEIPAIKTVVNPSDKAVQEYMQRVQSRIAQVINYPQEAVQKSLEGTVKIRLRILKDGSLADCDVLESSGYDLLDEDALNTAKSLAPFLTFSEDMQREDLVITVPIMYKHR